MSLVDPVGRCCPSSLREGKALAQVQPGPVQEPQRWAGMGGREDQVPLSPTASASPIKSLMGAPEAGAGGGAGPSRVMKKLGVLSITAKRGSPHPRARVQSNYSSSQPESIWAPSELFTGGAFVLVSIPHSPPEPSLEAQGCECQSEGGGPNPPPSAWPPSPQEHPGWCPSALPRAQRGGLCVPWAPLQN